jgi:hypothetical protein
MDVRVTNYDYKDGEATPYQAVLQAGTAMLVDDRGVPRVKCNCGNPLAEPQGTASGSDNVRRYARNPEEAWSAFAPRRVATISAGKKVKLVMQAWPPRSRTHDRAPPGRGQHGRLPGRLGLPAAVRAAEPAASGSDAARGGHRGATGRERDDHFLWDQGGQVPVPRAAVSQPVMTAA